jgi:hypothetical protein
MEPAKPIIGVDTHPNEQQLLVLHLDGVLRGYQPAGSVASMNLIYSVQGACMRVCVCVCEYVMHVDFQFEVCRSVNVSNHSGRRC